MNQVNTHKGPRISLVKVFSVGLAGVLLAFVLLSYFTFNRQVGFESVLVHVSKQALPNFINTSQIFNQAARLLQSTELLSKSSSQAAKRIVQLQLDDNLQSIRKASLVMEHNEFLDIQFDTINTELEEFSNLVSKRLELRNQMEYLKVKISILGEQASKVDAAASSTWLLDYLQALINVNQALDERRLQVVRFLFDQLDKRLVKLNASSDNKQKDPVKRQMINELSSLLFDKDGLVELKIKTLRLEGKVIGRENFVHSLIEDYVAHLGLVSGQTGQKMTTQVADSILKLEQQTQLIRFLLVAWIIFFLLIVIVFQRRLFKRLKIMTHIIRSEAKGAEYTDVLQGNDEITDLAESFSELTHTIQRQKHILEQVSMLDSVTGIANRQALDIRLAHDLELSQQRHTPLAVLLVDIDCFKQYNENYQSAAADYCLQKIAKLLRDLLTEGGDFVARYQGKDFICVLSDTDEIRAKDIAEKIKEVLKSQALPHEFSSVSGYVTVSIGISISLPEEPLTPEAIVHQAAFALNEAKASGKNTYKLAQQ